MKLRVGLTCLGYFTLRVEVPMNWCAYGLKCQLKCQLVEVYMCWNVYGLKCRWVEVSMGWSGYGLKCLCVEMSMGWSVYGLKCIWVEVSMGWSVYGLKCRWVEMSMGWSVCYRKYSDISLDIWIDCIWKIHVYEPKCEKFKMSLTRLLPICLDRILRRI